MSRPCRRLRRKVAAAQGPALQNAAASLTCDLTLVHRARQLCDGANVHRLNNVLALYCEAAGTMFSSICHFQRQGSVRRSRRTFHQSQARD